MAQTKRKRQTKHRGNAAGMIESRGRTGRKPTADERKSDAKTTAREQRLERMNRAPTWRSAINRAALATIFFAVVIKFLMKQKLGETLGLAAFVFIMYIPLGYYTDLWMYNRRQRNNQTKSKS
jgi:hypothetical protein